MAKNPKHIPNDHTKGLVEGLAISGLENKAIAQHLSISEATLKVHYKEQLSFGRQGVKALAASALVKAVKEGNVSAIIFFCKCRLGFRETDRLEVTGADGQPIEYKKVGTPKLKELTVTEWQEQFQTPIQTHLN